MTRTCTAPDCQRPHYGKGLCEAHYKRVHYRAHNPTLTPIRAQVPVDETELEKLVDEINAGASLREVARRHNLVPSTLLRRIQKAYVNE